VSRWDSAVSSAAWEELVATARTLGDAEEGHPAEDFELAELVRNKIYEVEGIEV
jgi:hypothetical protein